MMDIKEIVARLHQRAPDLARELLPHGRRDGIHWRCGDIFGSAGQSFCYTTAGEYCGWWKEFDGGASGDSLDLIAQTCCGGSKAEAVRWARKWLGLDAGALPPRRAATRMADADAARQAARRAEAHPAAQKLWLAAQADILNTPVAAYLDGRGCGPARLGRCPRALRYQPELWCEEVRAHLPAMVAAVTNERGQHVSTHRTWLAEQGGAWGKARLAAAKKTYGPITGGAINLWRGKSNRPLKDAPGDDTVAIAEGIEDALTVAVGCPEWRVIAAVSVGNLEHLVLPEAISDVVIVCQRDGENENVRRARDKAERRWMEQGRSVRRAQPPEGYKDFNAWHMARLAGAAA